VEGIPMKNATIFPWAISVLIGLAALPGPGFGARGQTASPKAGWSIKKNSN